MALGVIWGCRSLTLGEAVVCYHDWLLDQGDADGSYISHASMAARLGDKLTAATISRIRQRLKRLTLHEPLGRPNARNVGWVTTLHRQFIPRNYREIPGLCIALEGHLQGLAEWRERGRDGPDTMDATVQREWTPESKQDGPQATATGGLGGARFLASEGEAQLPSDFREKGDSARAPKGREGRQRVRRGDLQRPLDADEIAGYEAMLRGLPKERADKLRRIAGL